MADIDYYPSGTGLSSLYDKSNLKSMYRGEGAYDFMTGFGEGPYDVVQPNDPHGTYRGTWYSESPIYARTYTGVQALRDSPGIIRQMDVELPFKPLEYGETSGTWGYKDSSKPTINELMAHREFLKERSADTGTSADNPKIINVGTKKNPFYVTEGQYALGANRFPQVFTLNYPKEFVDANARVNVPESIKSVLRNTYKTWTPYEGSLPNWKEKKFWKLPSWAMAKNMMQDVTKGSQGIMAAYLNDIKKKYTPNWAKSTWLNNPATRTGLNLLKNVGWAGDVLLQGAALKDVYTGSSHVGDAVTNLNRAMNVPMDRQGRVIQDTGVYENLQRVAQRDVLNPNEMRGVTSFDTTRYNPREMNAGGIVSLMI